MKKLLLATFLVGSMVCISGCATPGYSGGPPTIKFPEERMSGEHANRYLRNDDYDLRQMIDDIDAVLLLDPASHMTKWNVR